MNVWTKARIKQTDPDTDKEFVIPRHHRLQVLDVIDNNLLASYPNGASSVTVQVTNDQVTRTAPRKSQLQRDAEALYLRLSRYSSLVQDAEVEADINTALNALYEILSDL